MKAAPTDTILIVGAQHAGPLLPRSHPLKPRFSARGHL